MTMHHGFAVFTTRWGAHFGGINTFNVDLCTALAETVPVWCIVLIATDDEREAARRVSLLSLTSEANELDVAMADRALALLLAVGAKPRWFIGHDTISGAIAITAARKVNARCAVFHHMAHGIYKSIEGYSPEQVAKKRAYQRDILRRADQVFAVGPSLLKSASDHLAGSDRPAPVEIIPGLALRDQLPTPHAFRALVSGRLEDKSSFTKQLDLSVASFGQAAALDGPLGTHPQLVVLGGKGAEEEKRRLIEMASAKAGRRVEVLPQAFELDRDKYFETLAQMSAVMMLSWYEAFGLVAWEAIAAGVPIVVSENTGVAALIRRELGEAARNVEIVPIRAAADPTHVPTADMDDVSKSLRKIAADGDIARTHARILRNALISKGYGWAQAAATVVEWCVSRSAHFCDRPWRTAVVGEHHLDAVQTGCASVIVVIDDIVAMRHRLAQFVATVARQPTVSAAAGQRLQHRGFDHAALTGEIRRSALDFIASSPLRAYAVFKQRPAGSSTSALRSDILEGHLVPRFQKKDHNICLLVTSPERRRDVVKAVERSWSRTDGDGSPPAVESEVTAPSALIGLADLVGEIVVNASGGATQELQLIRRKLVHIWNADSKKNYGLDTAFP